MSSEYIRRRWQQTRGAGAGWRWGQSCRRHQSSVPELLRLVSGRDRGRSTRGTRCCATSFTTCGYDYTLPRSRPLSGQTGDLVSVFVARTRHVLGQRCCAHGSLCACQHCASLCWYCKSAKNPLRRATQIHLLQNLDLICPDPFENFRNLSKFSEALMEYTCHNMRTELQYDECFSTYNRTSTAWIGSIVWLRVRRCSRGGFLPSSRVLDVLLRG
jgi:hypothetical protein